MEGDDPSKNLLLCEVPRAYSVSHRMLTSVEGSTLLESITSRLSDVSLMLQPLEYFFGESIHTCNAIITALILAFMQDIRKQIPAQFDMESVGWRNKYNIHLLSGVSQKKIYNENGVITKLVEVELVQKRPSQSRWGKQKQHYRFNPLSLSEGNEILSI